ncbi:Ig-like domain repeat protein [Granulicella sp. 5B5]|uniref:NHL domain-containing protein n=1 Tax=Granulicella sp. 5B5 TaxID=1617967 RepID=UPI0015F75DF7|nr:Ig-like domain repeat protein [Granulicella sp. 5B5]
MSARQLAIAITLLIAARLYAQVTPSSILLPTGMAYDTAGNLYFTDANRHQVFESTLGGQLLLIAGTGTQGYAGDNGPATSAQLNSPQALTIATNGTLYIADTGNNVVRAITNGTITTLAGTGKPGYSGDSGPATSAQLDAPNALTLDSTGALLVCDSANNRIRRIDITGTITTIAGTGIQGFSGDNGPATAAQFDTPSGIATANGVIYIADTHNHRIRIIDSSGTITTLAGTGKPGYFGDNGLATSAQLNSPRGLALTATGALLIADANNQRIRSISATGTITTLAGGPTQGTTTDGTTALSANLNTPRAVAISPFGYSILADAPNHTLRILVTNGDLYLPAAFAPTRTTAVTFIAAGTATVTGISTPQGAVQLTIDGTPGPTATLASGAATFSLPAGAHTITATYTGDGLNPAATSSAITLSAGKAAATVIMQPPSPNDYAGMPLLLNANVTAPTGGTPTGTVTFLEGPTTIATAQLTAGIASGVYLAPTAGSHTIVASYLGDANFAPGSAPPITAIVKPIPDFTIATTGTTNQTAAAGAIATYNLNITPQNGAFTGAVSLAVSGLPFGATASFAPPQVVPGASVAATTLSVQTLAQPIAHLATHTTAPYALLFLPLIFLRRKSRRLLLPLLPLVLFISGCGDRVNQPPTPAAGIYTLTVSATGTNLAGILVVHTTTVTLTIE